MIRLDNVSKQNGHQILFIEASMGVQKGEKVGLVGPNGAGKTTLFRMMTGQELPDDGLVTIDPGMRIGYFSQDVGEMAGQSAVAAVMDGVGPVSALAAEMAALEAAMVDPDQADALDAVMERYGEVLERFQELDGYALEARAREVLAGLSFSQERMDGDVGLLSGGWKMRVALARILLMRPDAMLLDEPSNHLDLESLIWLEAFLKTYDGALLMTSHDRAFMNRIIGKVVEIDGGDLVTYSGDLDFYDQQRALGEQQRQAQYERQQAMLAKEIKFIEKFKARASHAAQVQSRVKKLDKIERVEAPRRRQSVQFEFRSPPRSGEDVVSLRNIHKGYGDQPIYEGFDFLVRRKERWCVLGANGAGKSTLLKLVAGATAPDQGAVNIGASVKMGYFAQHSMDLLDGEETIFSLWTARSRRPARARCAPWLGASASPATMSKSRAAYCPAARRRVWSWPRCCSIRRTCWCSTSRPTTSTWRPRRCWSRPWRTSKAPCCLFRTTAISWRPCRTACWN